MTQTREWNFKKASLTDKTSLDWAIESIALSEVMHRLFSLFSLKDIRPWHLVNDPVPICPSLRGRQAALILMNSLEILEIMLAIGGAVDQNEISRVG